jgi:ABC-type lipoprotein release transport system permease subunit
MRTALRLVLADITGRFSLLLGAVLLIAAPMAGYLLLQGFTRGVDVDFAQTASSDLIVQESNSVGEIAGSRIAAEIETMLLDEGVAFAIPEIHSVTGSSAENAVLLRGIDIDRYRAVTRFEMRSGRPLEPGDSATDVMIGTDLAEARRLDSGDTILLRGREHRVVGVFSIGTYADNEVWLSLEGARELLGWDRNDVSMFVIPGDGPLSEGDVLPGPLSVARRGDFVGIASEWDPIFDLANFANFALAAAAAVILAVILWRMAWLRRRELAVLRAVGMSARIPVAYLALEGTLIALLGLAGGIIGARVMAVVVKVDAFGLSARALFDGTGIVRGVGLTAAILVAAVGAAGFMAARARPAEFLRGE